MIDMVLINRLLRSPAEVAQDCRDDRDLAAIARTALIVILVGAAVFGAVVGSWHAGPQIAYAAVKMPLVMMGTLVLCAPAFYAVAAVFGRAWSFRAVVSLALVAGARFALVLLATAPALWLAINLGSPYHVTKLVAALAYGLAGLAALVLLVRGLGDGPGKNVTIALFITTFLMVGGQSAWILRPYLGTPGQAEVAFLTRDREGGLAVQLLKSVGEIGHPDEASRP
jgi:hypothetical protein